MLCVSEALARPRRCPYCAAMRHGDVGVLVYDGGGTTPGFGCRLAGGDYALESLLRVQAV